MAGKLIMKMLVVLAVVLKKNNKQNKQKSTTATAKNRQVEDLRKFILGFWRAKESVKKRRQSLAAYKKFYVLL